MVRPNLLQEQIMEEQPNLEDILNNFEEFCDNFEYSAAKRFSGIDNESRQPIDNTEVQRVTPTVVREVDDGGTKGIELRVPPIDVQATEIPEA